MTEEAEGTGYKTTAVKLRAQCQEMERLMKPPVLSDEERAALHGTGVAPELMSKDDWWRRYSQLASYARRKEHETWSRAFLDVDESPLYDAVMDTPMSVELSSGRLVDVVPASLMRVAIVEDLYFWATRVSAFREAVKLNPDDFIEEVDALLGRLRAEANNARQRMYAQVCAPTPAPLDVDAEPADWTAELTAHDDRLLLHAWLEVNVRRLSKADEVIKKKYPLPKQLDTDGVAEGSLHGFPFMFVGVAYRENTSPAHVARDRSIVSVIAEYSARNREQSFHQEKAKKEASAKRAADEARRSLRRGIR